MLGVIIANVLIPQILPWGFKTPTSFKLRLFMENLPKLTEKQQTFLIRYFSNGKNASEAYRFAYNSNGNEKTVWTEASELLKNPKVSPWLEYYEQNCQEAITNELRYSAQDCFNELESLRVMAIESRDKYFNPNVNSAIKAVELKGKLAGHFKDKVEVSGGMSLANILDELK